MTRQLRTLSVLTGEFIGFLSSWRSPLMRLFSDLRMHPRPGISLTMTEKRTHTAILYVHQI